MTREQADKLIERVRAICLALPEVKEVEAWGHPTFRAPKKMFAACGSSESGTEPTLGLKVGFNRQKELLADPQFFPTPYAAHLGWVSLKLTPGGDWDKVTELVREAYRQVALKRMLKALDAE